MRSEEPIERLIDELGELLAEGVWHVEDLTSALDEEGLFEALDIPPREREDWLTERLLDAEGVWITPDGHVAALDYLLESIVLTHRVTESELERGMLDLLPDFAPLAWHELTPLRFGRTGVVDIADPEFDEGAVEGGSLVGPDGWLAGVAPGDFVGLVVYDGSARLDRVESMESDMGEEDALAGAFSARVRDDSHGELIAAIVFDALVEDPAMLSHPIRPLGELLRDGGLETRGDWCGRAGTDWQPPAISTASAEMRMLAERYDLDDCCFAMFDVAMEAWNAHVTGGGAAVGWDEAAAALGHGFVAPAFVDHVLVDRVEPRPELDEFAANVASSRADLGAAIAGYLSARNLEAGGATLAAETALQMAERAAPHYVPVVEDLAWYASDRGDVERALRFLRRVGVDADDPEVELLESMRPQRNAVGRNERCPCGSGRKYKDCCARSARLPLAARVDWLLHKLWVFTLRPKHQPTVLALGSLATLDRELRDALFDTGLPMDLAAFEGGLAAQFLAERGVLLPDDERDLLASWIEQPRAVWEVVQHDAIGRDRSELVLRDTVRGDVVSIELPEGHVHQTGELLLARVGEVDGRHRFAGPPVEVPAEARAMTEELLRTQPNAWDLARWLLLVSASSR